MLNMKRLIQRIAAILSAVSLLCFVSDLTVSDSAAADVSQDQLDTLTKNMELLINEARTELGLQPVYVVPYLCGVSKLRAEETTFKFSHYRPSPAELEAGVCDLNDTTVKSSTAIDRSIAPYYYCAENIAAGKPTAEETFSQWKNSSRHWKAITAPNITHMGVGVAYAPSSPLKYYWETLFIQTDKTFDDQFLPVRNEMIPKACGDINGDSSVDTFDYVVLAEYIDNKNAGKPAYLSELQLEAADCFKDGAITAADAKALQRYVLGEYKALPYVF